jgi:hypothetical protein
LRESGHIGIWSVGRGSEREPVLLELDYNPTGDASPCGRGAGGQGITFDSGGYSMKSSDNMLPMKSDMGGAAMVTGALALAISRGLNKRVKLILCCAENLVSGHAFKLGDILTYRNGISVEIQNTDAEGRLVLADGLLAASESGAAYILDAATLTGAAKTALGRDYNAVFALDEAEQVRALAAANAENEKAWPLPLEPGTQASSPRPLPSWAMWRPQKVLPAPPRQRRSCRASSVTKARAGCTWTWPLPIRSRAMSSGRPGPRAMVFARLPAGCRRCAHERLVEPRVCTGRVGEGAALPPCRRHGDPSGERHSLAGYPAGGAAPV